MTYFLGADVGGTKTDVVVVDGAGRVLGFARAGRGNPEEVGFDGLHAVLADAATRALAQASLGTEDVVGAGFGVAGYDWPHDLPPITAAIARLGLTCPVGVVNDAVPGLVIGSREGWGVGLVSGTGCNCWGWDRDHRREGRVTGHGTMLGEHAGAGELVHRAMQTVGHAWTRRIGPTALTEAFVAHAGAEDVEDLIAGYAVHRLRIGAEAALVVFEVAAAGDAAAQGLVEWAGRELGELANAVVRQLGFEQLEFDLVLTGGMFAAGDALVDPLRRTVHGFAPGARLVHLAAPPVLGAAMIGMERSGHRPDARVRAALLASRAAADGSDHR